MKAHPTEDEHKNQEQVSCPGSDGATPQSEASQSRRGDDDFEDRMQTALILEDHAGARDWLSAVVNDAFPGINVLLAPNLTEARAKLGHLLAAGLLPNIALVDLSLPDGNGLAFIRDMRESAPNCPCVVVTIHDDDRHVFPALRAGARGYLLKQQSQPELARRLRGIVAGEPPLSPSIAQRVLSRFAQPETTNRPNLTSREEEVLGLIAKGFTIVQAGDALGISRHTTAGYVKSIYSKLEVSTRAEVTQEALRMGLISTDG